MVHESHVAFRLPSGSTDDTIVVSSKDVWNDIVKVGDTSSNRKKICAGGYKCSEGAEMFFVKPATYKDGSKGTPHFRHKVIKLSQKTTTSVSSKNSVCSCMADNIHLEAQKLIADHIHEITFNRWKTCEKHCESWIAPKDSSCKLEVTIDIGTQKRRVDIAIYHQSKIIQTIEVYNTHKTSLATRTGVDFLEVDATHVVHQLRNKDFNIKCTQTTQKQCTVCNDDGNPVVKSVDENKYDRQITGDIDDDKYVYIQVSFSNKDKIKKHDGKWNKEHKLWYISKSKYRKNSNEIDQFGHKINWIDNRCIACGDSGISYWGDDYYGSCLECCCIDCGNKDKNCNCRECDKCEEIIINNEEHNCYKCEKCCEYSSYDNHTCELCIECGKYNSYVSVISHHKCWNCSQSL